MVSPLIGTCFKMCPYKEMKWREKNKLLHLFEIQSSTESDPKADPNKVIKQFSRSAAGKSDQTAEDLRPSTILLETVNYLIRDIIPLDPMPFLEIYNFIDNRIQAIRQDITIQMIEDVNSLQIYEKCVRFYIVSSYILCEESPAKFDQHLNSKQLTICLEKVLNLHKKFQSEKMTEMFSIHLSLNLTHHENFYKSGSFYNMYSCDNLVNMTFKVCILWIENNFIKFFKSVKELPLILQLCFFHQFGLIREQALRILSMAFKSTSCQFPLEKLSNWLCLSVEDTFQLCHIHKIKVENKMIFFSKKDFNVSGVVPKIKKEPFIESDLKSIELAELINGKLKRT